MTVGDNNTAIGASAGTAIDSSDGNDDNTFVGAGAGLNTTDADQSTLIGYSAGRWYGNNTGNNATGRIQHCTFIGSSTQGSSNTPTNQIVIGDNATGQGDNYAVIGDENITRVYMAQDSGATVYANNAVMAGGETTISEAMQGSAADTILNSMNLNLTDTTAWASMDSSKVNGGGLTFRGVYHSDGSQVLYSGIRGMKENNTSNNYDGCMVFGTIQNGGNLAEKMRITSGGYVGIGVAAPTAELDVRASASDGVIRAVGYEGNHAALELWGDEGDDADDGYQLIGTQNGGGLFFRTSKTAGLGGTPGWDTRMFMGSDGKIGIGTTSPTNLLNLVTDSDDTNLVLDTHHNTDSAHPNLIFRKSGGSEASPTVVADNELLGDIEWHAYDGDSYGQSAIIRCEIDGTPGDGDVPGALLFMTTPDGSQGSDERMRIDDAGNVGINTNAPQSLLHVKGITTIENSNNFASDTSLNANRPHLHIAMANGTADNRQGITMENTTHGAFGSIVMVSRASGNSDFAFFTENNGSIAQKMCILNDGSVGIGTSTPTSGTLQVNQNLTSGVGLFVYRALDSSNTDAPLVHFRNNTDGDDQPCLRIDQRASNATVLELHHNEDDGNASDTMIDFDFTDDSDVDGAFFCKFQDSSGTIGSITANGASAVAFNTSSDYRLKEDLKSISDAITTVNELKTYNFKWKRDGKRRDGLIAHELQDILPYAVNGEKDAVTTKKYKDGVDSDGEDIWKEKEVIAPQGIDYGALVPVLIKAVQELSAKVEALENK
jgi:hypothetical protein